MFGFKRYAEKVRIVLDDGWRVKFAYPEYPKDDTNFIKLDDSYDYNVNRNDLITAAKEALRECGLEMPRDYMIID